MSALIEKNHYYISQTGKVLIFDEEAKLYQSDPIRSSRKEDKKTGQLQTNRISTFSSPSYLRQLDNVRFSEGFVIWLKDLIHPEQFPLGKLQSNSKLRDYQEVGVRWLS